jgi:hypothetical protein
MCVVRYLKSVGGSLTLYYYYTRYLFIIIRFIMMLLFFRPLLFLNHQDSQLLFNAMWYQLPTVK